MQSATMRDGRHSDTHVAEQALAQLLELIGPDPELLRLQELNPSLSLVRDYAGHALRAGLPSPEATVEVATILTTVDTAIRADIARRVRVHSRQFSGSTRVVRAIDSAGGARLAAVLTRELCTALGYGKAMYSAVSGSCWSPVSVSVSPELRGEFDPLVAAVDGSPIPLRDAPREAELVRRRRPYAVGPAEVKRHTYRPLLDLSRPAGYLAVPVVVADRAVAIIHVDRHDNDLDEADFHLITTLAQACALATESARLRAAIAEQNRRTTAELDRLNRALRALEHTGVTLDDIGERPGEPRQRSELPTPTVDYPATLTARERDVLTLVAAGATNAAISRRLCISDGTVKSHVQRVFKKIGVSTRAEAAALYAGHRSPPELSA
ncbi:helix-turn-helix transcriptional regulator [Nocardia sp. alder85J]|uniref:helix-turn-helix transcriptional regulator n=1 Tax=Nocardia sp. alder85J TaxID=2862949 RepID=UPI001CD268ED|nr:LuxR C-terminal-related transcriptional regulator [Nocardia sp. alder85J]MCX4096695.1 LuxR C-terminal-related transcriptional regulator [Nocardia sp. alder85J]